MKAKFYFLLIGILVLSPVFKVYAQETLVNIPPAHYLRQNRIHEKNISANDTLELPFIDDFAREIGYPDNLFWEDDQAYINYQYPANSISIGVATLDAIDETGEIHEINASDIIEADSLTSKPINLEYNPGDSVYLSFYYQPGGLGDTPEPQDSLVVQFLNVDSLQWETVRQISYYHEDSLIHEIDPRNRDTSAIYTGNNGNKQFRQILIPVIKDYFLHKGFKFRFRNYASTSSAQQRPGRAGNVDHWNIDFVRLDSKRRHNDTVINDVAFIEPLKPLLINYESVPWRHFPEANAYEMKDSLSITYRNIGNKTWNISREFEIIDHMGDNPPYTFTGGTGDDIPPYTVETYPRTINYIFPSNDKDSALFEIKGYLITDTSSERAPFRWNDTINYFQKFYNYYAYDDGTAENGYGFDGVGSENVRVAYKFNTYKTDTLQAIQIYFNQVLDSANTNYFKLYVWDDQNGRPGDIILSQEGYRPVYEDSVNKFHNYALAEKKLISGAFYIGYEKFSTEMLNIGFDINRVNNDKLFYNLSGEWIQSGIEGTLMMRPVFGKHIEPPLSNNKDGEAPYFPANKINIFPNPVRDNMKVTTGNENRQNFSYSIYNLQGRLIKKNPILPSFINVSDVPTGIYIIEIRNKTNQQVTRKKFIVTR